MMQKCVFLIGYRIFVNVATKYYFFYYFVTETLIQLL